MAKLVTMTFPIDAGALSDIIAAFRLKYPNLTVDKTGSYGSELELRTDETPELDPKTVKGLVWRAESLLTGIDDGGDGPSDPEWLKECGAVLTGMAKLIPPERR